MNKLDGDQLAVVAKIVAIREHLQSIVDIYSEIDDDEMSIINEEPEGLSDTLDHICGFAEDADMRLNDWSEWSGLIEAFKEHEEPS